MLESRKEGSKWGQLAEFIEFCQVVPWLGTSSCLRLGPPSRGRCELLCFKRHWHSLFHIRWLTQKAKTCYYSRGSSRGDVFIIHLPAPHRPRSWQAFTCLSGPEWRRQKQVFQNSSLGWSCLYHLLTTRDQGVFHIQTWDNSRIAS